MGAGADRREIVGAGADRSEISVGAGADRREILVGAGADRREISVGAGADRSEISVGAGADRSEISVGAGTDRREISVGAGADRREISVGAGAEPSLTILYTRSPVLKCSRAIIDDIIQRELMCRCPTLVVLVPVGKAAYQSQYHSQYQGLGRWHYTVGPHLNARMQ